MNDASGGAGLAGAPEPPDPASVSARRVLLASEGRAIPKRALELGYAYEHPDLDEALRSALAS